MFSDPPLLKKKKMLITNQGSGEELTTKFELAETVFATAKLPADTNNVCLWLGVCTSSPPPSPFFFCSVV